MMPLHDPLHWRTALAMAASLLTVSMPSAWAAPNEVVTMMTMTNNFEFEPHAVTIHVGQAVEWRNGSRFRHTVTADPKLGGAALPAGAKPFASPELQPGESFRQILTVPGKYRFFCTPHEGIGMTGEITVLADK
jgi:plastocyanin